MATGAKCYLINQTSDGKWNLLEIPLGHDLRHGLPAGGDWFEVSRIVAGGCPFETANRAQLIRAVWGLLGSGLLGSGSGPCGGSGPRRSVMLTAGRP